MDFEGGSLYVIGGIEEESLACGQEDTS